MTVGAALVAGLVLRAEAGERRSADERDAPAAVFATSPSAPPPEAPSAALGPSFPAGAQLRPTGDAGQSKLWFHDGRWWGLLLAEEEFRIHAFDPSGGWTDTGTVVDARTSSHADVLAESGGLVVISAGRSTSAGNAVEVRRFTYDGTAKLYRADRQFPIRITSGGASRVSIARAGDGTLWAAFVTEQRLEVAHSRGDDRNWTAPTTLPVPDAAQPVDAAAVAAAGQQVVVLAATAAGGTFVAITEDGGSRWASESVLGGGHPDAGRNVALRVAGSEGGPRFVGVTDVPPAPDGNANNLAAHLVLVASDDGRTWSAHAVSRVEDGLTDPTLVLDEGASEIVVLAAAEGTIRAKRASLDRLAFPSGRGVPVLPADVGGRFQEPTSARVAPAGRGLVVVGADGGSGRYGHASVGVAGAPGRIGRSTDGTVLADTFEGRPTESGPPPGWQLASDAGTGELSLTQGIDGVGLRVRTAQGSSAARACRRFVAGRATALRVTMAVRYAGEGSGDAAIASLRGTGESVSLRVDERGRVAWFDGATKQVGTRTLAPATWYRVEIDVASDQRRFGFVVRDATGSVVAEAKNVAWRAEDATTPDQVCVSTREGPGSEVSVDDVRVQRS